jgi:hypothetical protein
MFGLFKKPAQEISFDNLRTDDKLIIKTINNQYQFKITDPIKQRGILTGGQLGNQAHEAVLICVTEHKPQLVTEKIIKTEAEAVFLIQLFNGTKHLRTTTITRIKLLRIADSWEVLLKSLVAQIFAKMPAEEKRVLRRRESV